MQHWSLQHFQARYSPSHQIQEYPSHSLPHFHCSLQPLEDTTPFWSRWSRHEFGVRAGQTRRRESSRPVLDPLAASEGWQWDIWVVVEPFFFSGDMVDGRVIWGSDGYIMMYHDIPTIYRTPNLLLSRVHSAQPNSAVLTFWCTLSGTCFIYQVLIRNNNTRYSNHTS